MVVVVVVMFASNGFCEAVVIVAVGGNGVVAVEASVVLPLLTLALLFWNQI